MTWQFKGLILFGVIGLLTVWNGTMTTHWREELDKQLKVMNKFRILFSKGTLLNRLLRKYAVIMIGVTMTATVILVSILGNKIKTGRKHDK